MTSEVHENGRRAIRQVSWDFSGTVVVITGAARGQGRAHALAFARAGADLVLADAPKPMETIPYGLSSLAELEATAGDCRAAGAKAVAVACDVRDAEQVDAMVGTAIAEFGRIDVLVGNAGVCSVRDIVDMTEQMWDEIHDTNVKGVFLTTRAVARRMIEARSGKIVLTGSVNSFAGVPGLSHYAAAKHAVAGYAKSLATELAEYGITVTYVCPGAVDTPMLGVATAPGVRDDQGERMVGMTGSWNILEEGAPPMQDIEITQAVLWLSSDAAKYVTGSPIIVDAGFTCK